MQVSDNRQDKLLPLDKALARIARFPRPPAASSPACVALSECYKRTLSASVRSPRDVPAFANSAVDGYAFAHKDAANGALQLSAESRTGARPLPRLKRGQAVRVFTGAVLPPGADSVAMEEDVRIDERRVLVPSALTRGANCRPRGDDIAKGTLMLGKGKQLRIPDIAVLAAMGIDRVSVFPRLRVALLSSGAELVASGRTTLSRGQIYDSNAPMLHRWLVELGCQVHAAGILPDDMQATEEALTANRNHDLIIASGGMSQSRLDCFSALCAARKGFTFWRVAIKPGRPVGLGRLEGLPFVGLPGNPVACFLTFALIAQPLIRRLAGQNPRAPRRFPAKMGFSWRKKLGRREFVRVVLAPPSLVRSDFPLLKKHGKSGAAVLSSVLDADGFAEMDESTTHYHCGDDVAFLPMREILP